VVDADTNTERGELLVVVGIIGVLPRIAQVHIVTDGDHHAALVVHDAAPGVLEAAVFVSHTAAEILSAGDLVAVVEIPDAMEDRVVAVEIDDGPIGKDSADTGFRAGPCLRPMGNA